MKQREFLAGSAAHAAEVDLTCVQPATIVENDPAAGNTRALLRYNFSSGKGAPTDPGPGGLAETMSSAPRHAAPQSATRGG